MGGGEVVVELLLVEVGLLVGGGEVVVELLLVEVGLLVVLLLVGGLAGCKLDTFVEIFIDFLTYIAHLPCTETSGRVQIGGSLSHFHIWKYPRGSTPSGYSCK